MFIYGAVTEEISLSNTTQWEEKGIHRKYAGVVALTEVIDNNLQLQGHPRFDELRYIIVDFLDIEKAVFDAESFLDEICTHAHISAAAAKTNPNIRVAVVATDETTQALTEFYHLQVKNGIMPWELRLFQSVDEARFWLRH